MKIELIYTKMAQASMVLENIDHLLAKSSCTNAFSFSACSAIALDFFLFSTRLGTCRSTTSK
jgi:hypothetical protein